MPAIDRERPLEAFRSGTWRARYGAALPLLLVAALPLLSLLARQ